MLSILIPVYNYNAVSLVKELWEQCNFSGINFEILCQDDASNSVINTLNQEINSISNGSFFINETNLGRGKNINTLAQKAQYDWLLILDCDTFPVHKSFIQKYCHSILNQKMNIVFGGIVYEDPKPQKEQLLRWVYGHQREALSLNQRNQNPDFTALTSNLLINKEVFLAHSFDASITKYGYEDLCFFAVLKANHFEISHIENPTFHLNLETSILFLNKTKTALENLVLLYNTNKISEEESKIIKAFELLQNLKLLRFTNFLFIKNKDKIERNLLSQKPSLFLFDLYKLAYFSNLIQDSHSCKVSKTL
ncbi:GT2 family glycosyltransferase [Flavobacterium sp. 270]|uniref:glycosyltransferase family 2 protein n=1 Tax=Flavobacterium sp. 270 TaxID=2512114 RepID=UPI0010652B51|nr:glycosyltransferase family A protein [Flavobacterium sp. 270]TDW52574.1 GT2 family glycosyltransferase [Flavobacterium sp. 270]